MGPALATARESLTGRRGGVPVWLWSLDALQAAQVFLGPAAGALLAWALVAYFLGRPLLAGLVAAARDNGGRRHLHELEDGPGGVTCG